jgi:hypothetical protein
MFEIIGLTGVMQTEAESKKFETSEAMTIPVETKKRQVLRDVRGRCLWGDRYYQRKGKKTKKGKVKGERAEKGEDK